MPTLLVHPSTLPLLQNNNNHKQQPLLPSLASRSDLHCLLILFFRSTKNPNIQRQHIVKIMLSNDGSYELLAHTCAVLALPLSVRASRLGCCTLTGASCSACAEDENARKLSKCCFLMNAICVANDEYKLIRSSKGATKQGRKRRRKKKEGKKCCVQNDQRARAERGDARLQLKARGRKRMHSAGHVRLQNLQARTRRRVCMKKKKKKRRRQKRSGGEKEEAKRSRARARIVSHRLLSPFYRQNLNPCCHPTAPAKYSHADRSRCRT